MTRRANLELPDHAGRSRARATIGGAAMLLWGAVWFATPVLAGSLRAAAVTLRDLA